MDTTLKQSHPCEGCRAFAEFGHVLHKHDCPKAKRQIREEGCKFLRERPPAYAERIFNLANKHYLN